MDQESMTLFSGDEAEESRTGERQSLLAVFGQQDTRSSGRLLAPRSIVRPHASLPQNLLDREGAPSCGFLAWSRQSLTPQAVLIQWVAGPWEEAAGSVGQPDDRVVEAKMNQDEV